MSDSVRSHGLQPARLLYPWDSPGKNIGVGCCAQAQRTFRTQGSHLQLLSPALTVRFLTTSATWDAREEADSFFYVRYLEHPLCAWDIYVLTA